MRIPTSEMVQASAIVGQGGPNVAVVSPAGAVYGSERSLLALLKETRLSISVFCPCGGALEREIRAIGSPVNCVAFDKQSLVGSPERHVRLLLHLLRSFKRVRADVVVINLDGNTPLVTLAAILLGLPIVRFCRFEFKPPTRRLDAWCWRAVRHVICPSEIVKEQFIKWAGHSYRGRTTRMYDPVDSVQVRKSDVSSFRSQYNLGYDKVVGFVGRLHRGKGIETAIRAIAVVKQSIEDVRLVIAGDVDGSARQTEYRRDLEALAHTLGISSSVCFIGYRPPEEMHKIMSAFDVCVLPSLSESFGRVLVESWSLGIPSVATDVGGISEITRSSGGGYLVPVGGVRELAQRIIDLLSDKSTADQMGERGRRWVADNCSVQRYASHFDALIQRIHREHQNGTSE